MLAARPYTDSDPHGQINRVFEIARDFDVDIDMHLDLAPTQTRLTWTTCATWPNVLDTADGLPSAT